jgi:hypothetical protein
MYDAAEEDQIKSTSKSQSMLNRFVATLYSPSRTKPTTCKPIDGDLVDQGRHLYNETSMQSSTGTDLMTTPPGSPDRPMVKGNPDSTTSSAPSTPDRNVRGYANTSPASAPSTPARPVTQDCDSTPTSAPTTPVRPAVSAKLARWESRSTVSSRVIANTKSTRSAPDILLQSQKPLQKPVKQYDPMPQWITNKQMALHMQRMDSRRNPPHLNLPKPSPKRSTNKTYKNTTSKLNTGNTALKFEAGKATVTTNPQEAQFDVAKIFVDLEEANEVAQVQVVNICNILSQQRTEAATVLQAHWRGLSTRIRLKKIHAAANEAVHIHFRNFTERHSVETAMKANKFFVKAQADDLLKERKFISSTVVLQRAWRKRAAKIRDERERQQQRAAALEQVAQAMAEKVFKQELLNKIVCARMIQKAYRAHLNRRLVAASIIQAAYLTWCRVRKQQHRAAIFVLHHSSALLIQQVYRAHFSRRLAAASIIKLAYLPWHSRKHQAATVIQCAYRKRLAKTALEQAHQIAVAQTQIALAKAQAAVVHRQWMEKMASAVVPIQRAFRSWRRRQKLKHLCNRVKAATTIQRAIRKWLLGKPLKAALIVQRAFRRWLLRKRYKAARDILRIRKQAKETEAALRIQGQYKVWQQRRSMQLFNSACLIQKVYRAYRARNHMRLTKAAQLQRSRLAKAAQLIQKAYRAYRARNHIRLAKAAQLIQTVYRTYRVRRHVQSTNAAILIQNTYRAYREHQIARDGVEVLHAKVLSVKEAHKAATVIQIAYRKHAVQLAAYRIQVAVLYAKRTAKLGKAVQQIQRAFRAWRQRRQLNIARDVIQTGTPTASPERPAKHVRMQDTNTHLPTGPPKLNGSPLWWSEPRRKQPTFVNAVEMEAAIASALSLAKQDSFMRGQMAEQQRLEDKAAIKERHLKEEAIIKGTKAAEIPFGRELSEPKKAGGSHFTLLWKQFKQPLKKTPPLQKRDTAKRNQVKVRVQKERALQLLLLKERTANILAHVGVETRASADKVVIVASTTALKAAQLLARMSMYKKGVANVGKSDQRHAARAPRPLPTEKLPNKIRTTIEWVVSAMVASVKAHAKFATGASKAALRLAFNICVAAYGSPPIQMQPVEEPIIFVEAKPKHMAPLTTMVVSVPECQGRPISRSRSSSSGLPSRGRRPGTDRQVEKAVTLSATYSSSSSWSDI